MVERGHRVILISGHNNKEKVVKTIDGIEVHYIPNLYKNEFGFYRRAFSFLKFFIACLLEARKIKADLVYATSTPLTVGAIALLLKKWNITPFVFEVRDIWPKAPIELGYINHSWPKKFLYGLEKRIYVQAEKIITLSPPMEAHVLDVCSSAEVKTITNFSDVDFFSASFNQENEAIQVLYAGSLGDANNPQHIIDLAEYAFKNHFNYHFHVAGEGKYTKELEQVKLPNFTFHGNISRSALKELYTEIHIALVNFKKHPVLNYNSPNKLFEGLAAGKVVAVNSNGWTKNLVEKHECGFYYNASELEDFFEKVLRLKKKSLLKKFSENSRYLAENHFNKLLLTKELLDFLAI